MSCHENQAAITGAGVSEIGRQIDRSGLALTLEAALKAIADAGLSVEDIDGIAGWPGQRLNGSGSSDVSIGEIKDSLGLKLSWFMGGPEGPGQASSLINAAMAVATGQANHVLCFRTVKEGSARRTNKSNTTVGGAAPRIGDKYQWLIPYGAVSATNWCAMIAKNHMSRYGVTREQLAQIALNNRKNAALNPQATYKAPLTMEDYLSSRMISDPLCLYDCDIPIDGATVIIVSNIHKAKELVNRPLVIEACSGALHGPDLWDQRQDFATMACHDAASAMWKRTSLKPGDVQFGQIYDGFSYLTLLWLEALGLCGTGESGRFIEGGERISLNGELPLNTSGGQLSEGRLHGFGLIYELCQQMWEKAGARQLGKTDIGVVGVGGGPLAASILVRRL